MFLEVCLKIWLSIFLRLTADGRQPAPNFRGLTAARPRVKIKKTLQNGKLPKEGKVFSTKIKNQQSLIVNPISVVFGMSN